jgi:hypothetical protein
MDPLKGQPFIPMTAVTPGTGGEKKIETDTKPPEPEVRWTEIDKCDYFRPEGEEPNPGLLKKAAGAAIVGAGAVLAIAKSNNKIALTAGLVMAGVGALLCGKKDDEIERMPYGKSPMPFEAHVTGNFRSSTLNDKEFKFYARLTGGSLFPQLTEEEQKKKDKEAAEYIKNLDLTPCSEKKNRPEEPGPRENLHDGIEFPEGTVSTYFTSAMSVEGSSKRGRRGLVDFEMTVSDSDRDQNLKVTLENGGFLGIENPDSTKPAKIRVPISSSDFEGVDTGQSLSKLKDMDGIGTVKIKKRGNRASVEISNRKLQHTSFTIEGDTIK